MYKSHNSDGDLMLNNLHLLDFPIPSVSITKQRFGREKLPPFSIENDASTSQYTYKINYLI